MPKNVKNSDFFSSLQSKPLREVRAPKSRIGGRVRISKYDLPFRKRYRPELTRQVIEIVAIATRRPPTYTIKDEQGKFYQKS